MTSSLFTTLSTYKPSESVNPEENYSTELLTHLLKFSLKKGTPLFSLFADEFLREPVSIPDYPDISIETQEMFYTSTKNKAFPDITIRIKDRHLFIEVKVESGLNHYEIDNGDNAMETINQVRKYHQIKVEPKSVYLLTKYPCELDLNGCDHFKGKFKWHDVHLMLKGYVTVDPVEDYLVEEIIGYMEDKGMSIPKVTFEFAKGMEMLNALFKQVETALEGRVYVKSFGYEWLGYNISIKSGTGAGEKAGWVGNYYEGTRLIFEHHNQNVIDHIQKNNLPGYEKGRKHTDCFFSFEGQRYFCLSATDQVDAIRKWIDENCGLIEKYGG
ncbi:MAG: hypothetical protein ACYC69_02910 [Thermodesulfovibrionales bacterium]